MNKKLLTAILVLILIVATLTAGIFIGKNTGNESTTIPSSHLHESTAQPLPETTAAITNDVHTAQNITDETTKEVTASPSANKTQPPENRIEKDKAMEIALIAAGLKSADVFDREAELDYERGIWVYEVSFEKDNIEYEYIIDAISGKILHSEAKKDR